jgi:ABC-2 type transport system permease protein
MMEGTKISFPVESRKFMRSRVPVLTLAALMFIPFIGGLFMFILKDPEMALRLGIITTKAQLVGGTADWPTYLGLLSQAISVGGLIVFGFVGSWIFGREYSDRTITDLLALPVSRTAIVLSKFLLVFLWSLFLSLLVFAAGLLVGRAVEIPGWTAGLVKQGFTVYLACTILTILLSAPVALFASIGRGYLSPLGFVIFTMVLAQIVAVTGYGHLFPWAIPALASGAVGSGTGTIGILSVAIVLLTSVTGLYGTVYWWNHADQS